jgi:hypothetical protein
MDGYVCTIFQRHPVNVNAVGRPYGSEERGGRSVP